MEAYFVFAFPNIAVGSPTALYRYFARHCCWHQNSQLSPSGFHCELEFFIVWFNKEYSSQLSALSSSGFSTAHLCFAFFLAASDRNFHISGHITRTRSFRFLASLPPDRVYPSGGLSYSRTNLVNHNSLSPFLQPYVK